MRETTIGRALAMDDTLAVILGGGRGTRLFPLTSLRSKPAVPFGGKYRLVDVPISNCLHSNLRRIFVLTQFNSQSLNRHLSQTYKFDVFSSGFVNVLAAEQTEESSDWFQGTADAVRQSMRHLDSYPHKDVVILSGDQLYHLDIRKMLAAHRSQMADATVAVLPVPAEQTPGFGILKVNPQGRIVHFEEKPNAERLPELASEVPGVGHAFLASMGIYIFKRDALARALTESKLVDFGRNVIPHIIPLMRVQAFTFRGYWEDVGTIRSYYDANLALCQTMPPFDFYDENRLIYTHPRFLPATKIEDCVIRSALISEGSILVGAEIVHSVVGIRARVGAGAVVRDSLILGADFFQTIDEIHASEGGGAPLVGVGSNSRIEGAIIDKNARIGRGVQIRSDPSRPDTDGEGFYVRDGIVVVPKGAVIPDGTVI
jgi:glucose-1-phosphate adenylyltransferase